MAVAGLAGAVGDLAGGGDDAVDGVEVFADFAGGWDQDFLFLEGGAEAGEEFAFERRCELAEFDFSGAMVSRVPFAEFLDEVIAEADAAAGVIDGGAASEFEEWAELLDLLRGGHVAQGQDMPGDVRCRLGIGGEFF